MCVRQRCIISALVTALGFTAACNSVLGVADVTLAPDAPDRSGCKLDERYPLITLSSSTADLTRDTDGSPSIFTALGNADALLISLHDNKGGHGMLQAPGIYQLTSADSKLETCGFCVLAGADYSATTKSFAQDYVASTHGQLQITTATTTQLIGSIQDLVLRHVRLDTAMNTTTPVEDGCTTTMSEIDFNLSYSSSCSLSCGSGTVCAADDGHEVCCSSGFPNWCRALNVCFAGAPQRDAACTNGYYGDSSVGCKAGQVAVSITGVTGSFCSPICNGTGSACPSAYNGKAGTCALIASGSTTPNRCALTCTDIGIKGGQCLPSMTCRATASGNGYCLY